MRTIFGSFWKLIVCRWNWKIVQPCFLNVSSVNAKCCGARYHSYYFTYAWPHL